MIKQSIKFLSEISKAKILRYFSWFSLFLPSISIIAIYLYLYFSLGDYKSTGHIHNLSANVIVKFDQFGVPSIEANSRLDGFRALGYVTARDRLFQMDLLRRSSSGRLAEIFGENLVSLDAGQRVYSFENVAVDTIQLLPSDQREVLQAYAEGVNSAIDDMTVLPFEFLLLGYQPEQWRIEDSLLVLLRMFQDQSNSEEEERMLSVMEQALPKDVYEFLTPMVDPFTQKLLDKNTMPEITHKIPVDSLVKLIEEQHVFLDKRNSIVRKHLPTRAASNAWAISGSKTRDGRAILANDMHTEINIPNLWYRCHVSYGDREIAGVNLPGTPLVVAGSSKNLSWGMTNLVADVLDLVKVKINPDNDNEYMTPDGWKPFGLREEIIKIKGGATQSLNVRTTIWGPISNKMLMNQPVAIKWTALDPMAINLKLIDIDQAKTLEEGIAIVNQTGGPPLNTIFADKSGRIAWTTLGRLPQRQNFNGAISQQWLDSSAKWKSYVPTEKHPRIIDPADGYVVNANNRVENDTFPAQIGHAFANGYRAFRITKRLAAAPYLTEKDMLQIQLDTKVGVLDFYQKIALVILTDQLLVQRTELRSLRDYLVSWDHLATTESKGLALIVGFRKKLARTILEPFLLSSKVIDNEFEYGWAHMDVALQAILLEKNIKLLSQEVQKKYKNWDMFILAQLEEVVHELLREYRLNSLHELTWGIVNKADYAHPLGRAIPFLGYFLNFPKVPLSGCDFCVKVDSESFGATERLVVSPSNWDDGILHIPGGQSGNPLSTHYQDQFDSWIKGFSSKFFSDESIKQLKLIPMK